MSGAGRYGSGPRSDPHDGQGGRREVPFGPEISWPYGFRQLDPESRDVLESAYGSGAYQLPAMDDYGDPGYSDPSYEGPRTPYNGSALPGATSPGHPGRGPVSASSASSVSAGSSYPGSGSSGPAPSGRPGGPRPSGYQQPAPGYHVPDGRDSARPGHTSPGYQRQEPAAGREIWPVTGAQEALPDTGPQRALGPSGSAATGAYPEQWYGNPRLDDRVTGGGRRDPRLEGINYGELRYDEFSPGERGYDEPLDDESWYEELRRSGPSFPQGRGTPAPGGPLGPGGPPGSGGSFGSRGQRRAEPQGPGFGAQPGFSPGRTGGYDRPRGDWDVTGHQGPQLSAGRTGGPGQRSGGQAGSPFPAGTAAEDAGFLAAPVGVLTPPSGTRVDALRDEGLFKTATPAAAPAAPAASRPATGAVRPGRGLDGPEITSSWPAQPATDVDSYQDFWRDDVDEEYTGLFGDRDAEFERADAKQAAARRRIGRRRSGSNDRRLWLGLGGVIVIAAAAIVGVIKFEFPAHSGPAHTFATPAKIGSYARTADLEKQTDVAQLRSEVIRMSAGEATGVQSAVYKSGNPSAGSAEQIIMLIQGHLANADPAVSITTFTEKFVGAYQVSAGSLGGKAACVQEAAASVSMCVWFDDDSFGEIVSPTMKAAALAKTMLAVRPSVEVVAAK